MSENQNRNMEPQADSEQSYSFYWNYSDQLAHDRKEKKQTQKRGVIIYVVSLVGIFCLCLAMLIGAILWSLKDISVHTIVPSSSYAETVAQTVSPSVVLIQSASSYSAGNGTGFFITSDGYIATNYHVVADATSIKVTLYRGQTFEAKLVGYRAEDDLAVLKIATGEYPVAPIGNSDTAWVGSVAIAIGNPGGADGGWTTTQGIISARNRTIAVEENTYFSEMKMLQTDAPVNPGNSGGPLCNAEGEVIGIVTSKMTEYEGIGYAIPINEAMLTLQAIIDGKLEGFVSSVSKSRPKIGVTGAAITNGEQFTLDGQTYAAPTDGFLVTEVSRLNGAYGIVEAGDIICAINGVSVTSLESFKNELYKCHVGQTVSFDLYRKGEKLTVQITLGVS